MDNESEMINGIQMKPLDASRRPVWELSIKNAKLLKATAELVLSIKLN